MPLATNPKAMFEIVLESDKELPENERPVFVYHYLTGFEEIELTNLLTVKEDAPKSKSKEVIDETFKAAMIGLAGWRNVLDRNGKPIDFAPEKLKEIMGMIEASELSWKLFNAQFPSLEDKKKSDGQSESNSAKSARDAKDEKNAPTE